MRTSVFLACAMASLLLAAATISDAASNLNLSKSNINRVAHPPVVTVTKMAMATSSSTSVKPVGPCARGPVRPWARGPVVLTGEPANGRTGERRSAISGLGRFR